MLMQNLHNKNSLYNGTRMIIIHLYQHYIGAWILDDKFDGQSWILFRAFLITNNGDFFFKLTQKQFLIRVYFAMIVNKSQDQSLNLIGIDL